MKILVFASDTSWNELVIENIGIEWIRAENIGSIVEKNGIDAYFNLSETASQMDYTTFNKPVFINSVSDSLLKIAAPGNVVRINGWNGFLKRSVWEISGKVNDECAAIIKAMKKIMIQVPDEPGFISARIIAMIINEAYFAMAEGVSTKKEIDTAMKLGTNYPHGPFEWAKIIGIQNIYALLKILSETDNRYKPSMLLEEEAKKN